MISDTGYFIAILYTEVDMDTMTGYSQKTVKRPLDFRKWT